MRDETEFSFEPNVIKMIPHFCSFYITELEHQRYLVQFLRHSGSNWTIWRCKFYLTFPLSGELCRRLKGFFYVAWPWQIEEKEEEEAQVRGRRAYSRRQLFFKIRDSR